MPLPTPPCPCPRLHALITLCMLWPRPHALTTPPPPPRSVAPAPSPLGPAPVPSPFAGHASAPPPFPGSAPCRPRPRRHGGVGARGLVLGLAGPGRVGPGAGTGTPRSPRSPRSGLRARAVLGRRAGLPEPGLLLRGQPLRVGQPPAAGPPVRHQAPLHQRAAGVGAGARARLALEGALGAQGGVVAAGAAGAAAGGAAARHPAAAAAHHDPVPGPPDPALHGLLLALEPRPQGGVRAPFLAAGPGRRAVAAEPGGGAADGGAGVPRLHAAHAAALRRAPGGAAGLPPLLRAGPFPPRDRAAALPPGVAGQHPRGRRVPVLLHRRVRRLHGLYLPAHRSPGGAGGLSLLLQRAGLPGAGGGAGTPPPGGAAALLPGGGAAVPAAAAAPHPPPALRGGPPRGPSPRLLLTLGWGDPPPAS